MRVLISCEHSGVVRDKFIEAGYHATSCDILPTESPGPHYLGDVRDILDEGWDMMIAFPPCTHLCGSGARWWPYKVKEQEEALDFISLLLDAPIPKVALENPVGVISSRVREPDQIIQPYQFGHNASKRTCLWLKNLPLLIPTKLVAGKFVNGNMRWANQSKSGQNNEPGSWGQGKRRSRTYSGIADAFVSQWGEHESF
jgi:hypothetical protein